MLVVLKAHKLGDIRAAQVSRARQQRQPRRCIVRHALHSHLVHQLHALQQPRKALKSCPPPNAHACIWAMLLDGHASRAAMQVPHSLPG